MPRRIQIIDDGYARAILDLLLEIHHEIKELRTMTTQNLAALTAQVQANTAVESSALALINGFAAQLQAAISAANDGDDAALPALQSSLQTSATSLAAAVAANTPAAPAPVVTPTAPSTAG